MRSDTINSVRKLLPGLILFLLLVVPSKVGAECSVSVTPNNVVMGAASVSTFTVSNTGEAVGNWVRIQSPGLSAYTIANMEASGWYPNGGGTEANFAGGYLEGGTSSTFNLTLAETGEVVGNMDWEALLSYDDGANFESCGNVTLQIIPAPSAPQISNASLTVGNSSATLTWSTDLTATGIVNYGTTSGYGSSVSSASGTSHTVTMNGLSASTTYHYQIQVTSEGGTTSTTDATFTTSAASVITTTTTTVTNTVTTTNTQTVTQVVTDTTAPNVKINVLTGDKKNKVPNTRSNEQGSELPVYESAPEISGSVIDDRGIAKIEFRIKNLETSWSSASLEGSVGAKKSNFELLPPVTLDGTYTIEVRGIDVFGNVSVIKSIDFVIDQMLPTIGGGVVSYGAMPLYAINGIVTVLAGREYEVILKEEGGADSVTLVINNNQYPITKLGTQGLWRGIIKFGNQEVGERIKSVVKARDGAGNETEREWVKFRVLSQDSIPASLFWLDPTTKRFEVWEAVEYGQEQGKLGWYVPGGVYYVQSGRNVSQRIVMENDGWIAGSFEKSEPTWYEKLLSIRRRGYLAVPPAYNALRSNAGRQWHSDTVTPELQVGREKWIGKKSVVYIGLKELPWYSETLKRASEWAGSEGAQMVEMRAEIVKSSDHSLSQGSELYELLPQVYLVNDRGDTLDYKEGVWER